MRAEKMCQNAKKTALAGLLLGLLLALSAALTPDASAVWYPDAEGHWARDYLYSAAEAGWLTGFEDGTMRPDEPVTAAQAAAVFCRVLDANAEPPASEKWYASAQANGLALAFLDEWDNMAGPISRLRAFKMLCDAMQLYSASADLSALDAYNDTYGLTHYQRLACASLIGEGIAEGYGGSLNLSGSLTRAEFAALLWRVLDGGGVSRSGAVSGWSGRRLWLGCASGPVTLRDVTADTVIIRTRGLTSLEIDNCRIGTLVLAHTGDLTVSADAAGTIRVGSGLGNVVIAGGEAPSFPRLEITDSGRSVVCTGRPEEVRVCGYSNSLRLCAGAGSAVMSGQGCCLVSDGQVGRLEILGEDTVIAAEDGGRYDAVLLRAPGATLPAGQANVEEDIDIGLRDAWIELRHPDALPAGETLRVEAVIYNAPAGMCRASWTVDGAADSVQTGPGWQQGFTLERNFTYTADMPPECRIALRVEYTTPYGQNQAIETEYVQPLENEAPNSYSGLTVQQVLSEVTDFYYGDYTLDWALRNDYSAEGKEIFVNAMGYASDTAYLVWISKSCQRVNVFLGSRGNWSLIRTCIVGTGAPGTPTPSGVFKVTTREPGWFMSDYTVRPVVRFKGGGYAFHSRLYWPGTETLKDGDIGYPVSHGCVRMYDEDIWFMYDYIPGGTTVVSY